MKTPFFAPAALRVSLLLLGITVLSSAARLAAATAPILAAPTVSLVAGTSATLGATVISDGGSPITKRGVVVEILSTGTNPNLDGTTTEVDDPAATTGAFTETPALETGVLYSFTAFATNSVGTTSTSPVEFSLTRARFMTVTNTNDSGSGSLRAVLASISGLNGTNFTIQFDPSLFTSSSQTINLESSLPKITSAVTIVGPGAGLLTINGGNGIRPFVLDIAPFEFAPGVTGNGSVVISGLTLTNTSIADNFGGAIMDQGAGLATLVVSNCVFTNDSVPVVSNQSGGGAIYYDAPLYIDSCTFSGCGGQFGGAVGWSPSANTENTGSPVVISNSTFTGNTGGSDSVGGAIYVQDALAGGMLPTVINCTFYGNSADYGSAICTAEEPPGPIFIRNCTVSGNTAGVLAAIFTDMQGTLVNCIVSGNTSSFAPSDVDDASSTSSNNLIGVSGGGPTNGINGNIVGVTNPLLSAPGNYGGVVQTMAVLPGSPAIGGGTATGAPPLDERGVAYALTPDIGAFQSQGFSLSIASGNNQSASVGDAFADPLVVTVTANAATDPVNGGVVDFNAPNSGASLNPASGAATISSGSASYSATANTSVGGPYTVTAGTVGASSPVGFSLTNTAGPPSSMVANTGTTPQESNLDTAFTHPLAVTVTDASNNPVSGVGVTFTAPASGASGTFSNNTPTIMVTTNASGVASAPFTANSTAGSYTVTAASKGLTTVDFSLTNATATPRALQAGTTATLDRQTGLFDFTVNVTNTTASAINGFRLHVNYHAYLAAYPSLKLYNASSNPGASDIYVDYPFPVASNATVPVMLEFYTSNRQFPNPFTPTLTVDSLSTSEVPNTHETGTPVRRIVRLADKTILIEWSSIATHWYRVSFSSDMKTWYDCPTPLQAGSNQMQWIDSGPPFTNVSPADPSVTSRFYIVNEIATP